MENEAHARAQANQVMKDVFFQPGQPRTRRIFLRDASSAVTGVADRREGLDITWTKIE